MKDLYRALAFLITFGVFVQAGSIALGWFTVINDLENGGVLTSDSEGNIGHAVHSTVGMTVLPALALIFLIVSFFARVPGGVRSALVVFGLVVLQVILAFIAFGAPIVGALHGANALAIVGASISAGTRVRRATTPDVDPAAQPAVA